MKREGSFLGSTVGRWSIATLDDVRIRLAGKPRAACVHIQTCRINYSRTSLKGPCTVAGGLALLLLMSLG